MGFLIIAIIVAITVAASYLMVRDWKTFSSKALIASSFVSSLGLLGTFWGIHRGLTSFDAANIETSIPLLLAGMQTAFATSIAGLLGSLVIKLVHSVFSVEPEQKEDVELQELIAVFKQIGENTNKLAKSDGFSMEVVKNVNDSVEVLTKTLIANQAQQEKGLERLGDKLASQLSKELSQKLATNLVEVLTTSNETFNRSIVELNETMDKRLNNLESAYREIATDTNSNLEALNENFDTKQSQLISEFRVFANKISDHTSKTIVKSLEKIIKDFNIVVSNQLGENFQAFNEGVVELRNWQISYKAIIEKNADMLVNTNDAIQTMADNHGIMIAGANDLIEATKGINDTLKYVDESQQLVHGHLHQIMQLNDKVKLSITNLDEYYRNNTNAVDSMFKQYEENLVQFTDNYINTIKSQQNQLLAQCEALEKASISNQVALQNSVDTISTTMESNLTELTSSVSKNVNDATKKLDKTFAKQGENFTSVLEEQVSRSLEELGRQLVYISKQFADDYIPLTEKLQKLLQIAEDVKDV